MVYPKTSILKWRSRFRSAGGWASQYWVRGFKKRYYSNRVKKDLVFREIPWVSWLSEETKYFFTHLLWFSKQSIGLVQSLECQGWCENVRNYFTQLGYYLCISKNLPNFFENYSVECYNKIIRNILAGYLQTLAKRRGVKIMCGTEKDKCQFPEKLKGKPEDCSPEQIKECHGEGAEHPCVESKEEE